MTKRGLIIGAGGDTGFAWSAAMLSDLEAHLDWDARDAELLVGTSAGALQCAFLASGVPVADVIAWRSGQLPITHPLKARPTVDRAPIQKSWLPMPAEPRLALRGLTGAVPAAAAMSGLLPRGARSLDRWIAPLLAVTDGSAWVKHPNTRIVAVDCTTGKPVVFGSPDAPKCGIGAAVLASASIPGVFPPVEIEARRYMDGAVATSTSAHLAIGHGLDELIVLAPLAGAGRPTAPDYLLRQRMRKLVLEEVKQAQAAGLTVRLFTPTAADIAVMGPNSIDIKRSRATFDAVMKSGPSAVSDVFA
jgi:NTE family protein